MAFADLFNSIYSWHQNTSNTSNYLFESATIPWLIDNHRNFELQTQFATFQIIFFHSLENFQKFPNQVAQIQYSNCAQRYSIFTQTCQRRKN